MRPVRLLLLALLLLGLLPPSCVNAPKVLQGQVVRYEAASKMVVVKDDLPPSPELTLSLEGAEVGADPKPGDKVRLAYFDKGGELKATRLANLSRQSDLRGGKKK